MISHNSELARQNSASQTVRDRLLNPSNWVKKSAYDLVCQRLDESDKQLREVSALATSLTDERDKLRADLGEKETLLAQQMDRIFALENLGFVDVSGRKRVADIVAEVLAGFPGILWKDVVSARKTKRFVIPRHTCMYEVARQRDDLSFPMIGRIFGGKDHTTVIHAVHKMDREMQAMAA